MVFFFFFGVKVKIVLEKKQRRGNMEMHSYLVNLNALLKTFPIWKHLYLWTPQYPFLFSCCPLTPSFPLSSKFLLAIVQISFTTWVSLIYLNTIYRSQLSSLEAWRNRWACFFSFCGCPQLLLLLKVDFLLFMSLIFLVDLVFWILRYWTLLAFSPALRDWVVLVTFSSV